MTEEIWKDIPGYEGLYKASNLGRVQSLDKRRKNGAFREGCILKMQTWPHGYKKVTLYDGTGSRKTMFVHRIVAITFIDNPNNYAEINHIDEDPSNNNVNNLEWCTKRYNQNYGHRLSKVRGENNAQHKLTEEQVKEIKRTYKYGVRMYGVPSLSKQYGVSCKTVQNILDGIKWKHI